MYARLYVDIRKAREIAKKQREKKEKRKKETFKPYYKMRYNEKNT